MAKRVFFSFDYQDVIDFRANVVRNHWIIKLDREDAAFLNLQSGNLRRGLEI